MVIRDLCTCHAVSRDVRLLDDILGCRFLQIRDHNNTMNSVELVCANYKISITYMHEIMHATELNLSAINLTNPDKFRTIEYNDM